MSRPDFKIIDLNKEDDERLAQEQGIEAAKALANSAVQESKDTIDDSCSNSMGSEQGAPEAEIPSEPDDSEINQDLNDFGQSGPSFM